MGSFFQSLEQQSYEDFEVVLIDDCSTDDTFDHLEDYVKKTKLAVKLYRNSKNSGPGETRNQGILMSNSEYFLFVDSDDYLEPNTLLEIDKVVNDNDLIVFDFMKGNHKKSTIPNTSGGSQIVLEVLKAINTSVWGKVFKKDIIINNNIAFPSLTRFEDFVFLFKYICCSKSIFYLRQPLYNYVYNSKSIVHTVSNPHLFSQKAFELIGEDLKVVDCSIADFIYIREVLYVSIKASFKSKKIKEAKKEVSIIEAKYPNWYKNVNYHCLSFSQRLILRLYKLRLFVLLKALVSLF